MSWMKREHGMTPAKRKRLIKTYGPCPAGYTFEDLERFLDLLYGLYDDTVELRRMTVCNPFDRSETPQRSERARRDIACCSRSARTAP